MKKRIFLSLLILVFIWTLAVSVHAADPVLHWYCARNKEHRQPRLDANMQFIEEYNGCYVDRKHGDGCEDKVLYLTFDAGYENGNVARILDVLKQESVTGTFFVLEHLICKNTELLRRMAEEGHTVANHTASHKNITRYESKEALADYAVHPLHQEAKTHFTHLLDKRYCADYEV